MASSAQDLERFVGAALGRGVSRSDIEGVLERAGWPDEQVRAAMATYADLPFVVPVPRPRPYLSAREAFLYLVLFTTLYLSAYHLGTLLFQVIEHIFPDKVFDDSNRFGEQIRWSVASVIIAFPIFIAMSVKMNQEMARQPTRRQSSVRRWLAYLTLFIAAVVLICDFTTLIDHLLGGELTMRFVLKVIVAAMIAAVVFGYYLWDLRRDEVAA